MRKLIFLLLLVLAGYVGYIYFFGKEDEKAKAHSIVNETKDLGRSVADFIKGQKDKYDDGEFDALVKKIRSSLDKLRGKTEKNSDEVQKDLRDLENQLKQIDPDKLSEEKREELRKLLQDLEKELK